MPDLWLTVSRYLASLKAVLAPANALEELLAGKVLGYKLTREQLDKNWRQYEQTEQLVRMFMLNEGPELQRDLKEYANKCQNWVSRLVWQVGLKNVLSKRRPSLSCRFRPVDARRRPFEWAARGAH